MVLTIILPSNYLPYSMILYYALVYSYVYAVPTHSTQIWEGEGSNMAKVIGILLHV